MPSSLLKPIQIGASAGGGDRRTRVDISQNMTNLSAAISEQNLEKYGYSIGDYFIGASGFVYTLADLDTFYGGANYWPAAETKRYAVLEEHHIAIVVDTKLTTAYLSSGSYSGYKNSTLHNLLKGNSVLAVIKTDIAALTGDQWSDHLLAIDKLYETYSSSTYSWVWSNGGVPSDYISALTEIETYGCRVWGTAYSNGEGVKQLELFRKFRFNEIFGNAWFWLRSTYTASIACSAGDRGLANCSGMSSPGGLAVGLILYK